MNNSNDTNVIPNINKKIENSKQNLIKNHLVKTGFYDENLPYPKEELDKWKKHLIILRAKTDINSNKKRSPIRRLVRNKPLHEVFMDMMNTDSFSAEKDKKNADDIFPKWQVNNYRLEDVIDPHKSDPPKQKTSKNVQQMTAPEKQYVKSLSAKYQPHKVNNILLTRCKSFI